MTANVVEKLQALIARSTAITMGTDMETDASALMTETNPLWSEISDNAVEMLPVVTAMATSLKAALEKAPDGVKEMFAAYEERAAEAKFDWIEPPRMVSAFVLLDALERIRVSCEHKVKKHKR